MSPATGAAADKLIWCHSNHCIQKVWKVPATEEWPGSTLYSAFPLFMQRSQCQLKLSASIPSTVYLLLSGKLNSPTEWQASWSRCAFHMVNSFKWARYCAAIIQHLLYGMEKMHCHQVALKEPFRGCQGLTKTLRLWQWHGLVGDGCAACILVGSRCCRAIGQAKKMKCRCRRLQRQKIFVVWPCLRRVHSAN